VKRFGMAALVAGACFFGCRSESAGVDPDGAGGSGGMAEYDALEAGDEVRLDCPESRGGEVVGRVESVECSIRYGRVYVTPLLTDGWLESHVSEPSEGQVYSTPGGGDVRGGAGNGVCSISSFSRTPCTIVVTEYNRASLPVDGMAGSPGTAIEVGSSVTMLVECPEGLGIDLGDDASEINVALEPSKFSLHAEDCEVTW
jgi:hypothetical protein